MPEDLTILPTPETAERRGGHLTLAADTTIACDPGAERAAAHLQRAVARECALQLQVNAGASGPAAVRLRLDDRAGPGPEGYCLEIDSAGLDLRAPDAAGLHYGVQTLSQLLPGGAGAAARQVPALRIVDRPRHRWRAFMLDSGRQYQSVAFIKRYLDLLAALKLNAFHWHLTEGLGWRLEIERHSRLTEVGARVADGPEQQGFYSRGEIRDVVAYAAERHIRVIPEIDVPGHSEAALTAYPEFTCRGEPPPSPKPGSGHCPVIFCGGKESVYAFLGSVLDEVCDLFPDEVIHLGGDEAPKDEWDRCPDCRRAIADLGLADSHALQVHFSNRLAEMAAARGRRVVLWDDVVSRPGPPLRDDAIVHWWTQRSHGDRELRRALAQGHDVLCTPNYYCYLNFPTEPWSIYREERTFGLRQAYCDNPADVDAMDGLSQEDRRHLLGLGAALWCDGGVRQDMIDRRVFPRIMAHAELMWHRGERLDFDSFRARATRRTRYLGGHAIEPGPDLAGEAPPGFSWE